MFDRDFTPANGNPPVRIEISDDGDAIRIVRHGECIGTIDLDFKQEDYGSGQIYEYFYITHMALERCRHQGIGRASLLFHKEAIGMPIAAADAYGPQQEDGSHLTGDGVPFIQAMREEGIVCKESTNEFADD